ncbi:hypothetical protein MKX01_014760 [Papaver californicum]|nr:hypothetical protein MKX01_014760 [Papaver californicum]
MKSNLVMSRASCYGRFTCGICMESLPFNKKFKTQNLHKKRFQCLSHPFCCNCISSYIKVKVEHINTSEIKCHDTKCDMILDPLTCRSILSKVTFVRWCKLLCESAVLSLTSDAAGSYSRGKSAYCPYKRCSELILNECGLSSPIVKTKCPNCKNLFCFGCQVPWQANHLCDIKKKDSSDRQLLALVKRNNWRCCPTCNQYIERIDVVRPDFATFMVVK